MSEEIKKDQRNGLSVPDQMQGALTTAMHTGTGLTSPFMKDIFLTKQSIVGTRFVGGSRELVEDLDVGSRITFLREPQNRFDERAVMALDDQGRKLGYIPRHENAIIGALMDVGKYFYGILTKKPSGKNLTGEPVPGVIWMDLYMREFALPDDLSEIPRQGYQGSYVVLDLEAEQEDAAHLSKVFAIKVINGEERGIFHRSLERMEQEEVTDTEYENMIRELQRFIGYLPIVCHGKDESIDALAEAYGVMTGKPFSNHVVDTMAMARNHFYGMQDFSLEYLADYLGIEGDCTDEQEKRCRRTWQLYCRMERSELSPHK